MTARTRWVIPMALAAVLLSPDGSFAAPAAPQSEQEREHPPAGCALCHTTSSWRDVTYPRHQQTRLPLTGAHRLTPCLRCHPKRFEAPAAGSACRSCHEDAHDARLGLYCEACHDADRWRDAFDADAHRRSNFPLLGAHAFVPCRECHQQALPRGFSAISVVCGACHLDRWQSTGLRTIDHAASDLGQACERCHDFWRFAPARFAEHDVCFQLSGGPHTTIPCQQCHVSLVGLVADGSCNTNNARCTACHRHARARTEVEHEEVLGFQYKDRKCYECHRFAP